jgi:hypothetical protein
MSHLVCNVLTDSRWRSNLKKKLRVLDSLPGEFIRIRCMPRAPITTVWFDSDEFGGELDRIWKAAVRFGGVDGVPDGGVAIDMENSLGDGSPRLIQLLLFGLNSPIKPALFVRLRGRYPASSCRKLAEFLSDRRFARFGFAIGQDEAVFRRTFGARVVVFDLQRLAPGPDYPGLAKTMARIGIDIVSFLVKWDGGEAVGFPTYSKWEARELCRCQEMYAYTDVWSIATMFEYMVRCSGKLPIGWLNMALNHKVHRTDRRSGKK